MVTLTIFGFVCRPGPGEALNGLSQHAIVEIDAGHRYANVTQKGGTSCAETIACVCSSVRDLEAPKLFQLLRCVARSGMRHIKRSPKLRFPA